jgi:hypothetical protein
MGRSIADREHHRRRILLEMKGVSRNSRGDPAVRRAKLDDSGLFSEVKNEWLMTLTFIAVTSPVERGEVNAGPSPRDDTVSTSVRVPPEWTTND